MSLMTYQLGISESRPCSPRQSAIEFDSIYQRLDEIGSSFLKQASNACKKVLARASTVEPIFIWPSPTETVVAPLEYQILSLIYAEREHHIELTDEDVVLPEYCSRALNAFDHYRCLEDDWDGEGAEAPTEKSLNEAMYFLRTLGANIQEIAEARPMIDAEGIPGIFWSMNAKYLSVSFYGDFTLTYFYRDKQTEEQEVKTLSLDDADCLKHLLYLMEEL